MSWLKRKIKIKRYLYLAQKLFEAVERGDVTKVKEFLKKGADVNAKAYYYGEVTPLYFYGEVTPLHLAARYGYASVVELLIKHGADVNAKTRAGLTPLHAATCYGHVEVAELLISHGADVNARDNDGSTPLHLAAQEAHVSVVELLIKHGADVNARDNDGSTPLHLAARYAAYGGHVEVAELLISHGADVNAKSNYGLTPLYDAARKGHASVAELLIKHGTDVNAKTNDGWTPLHAAAYNGHVEVVRLLLERGADPTVRGTDGKTPLDVAGEKGRGDAARIIEEFIKSSMAILGVEAPELYAGEWGRVIVRARGMGEARISIEGDAEFEAPRSVELRGEKSIELLVKPTSAEEVPIKITLESLGIKVTKMFTLKVKSKVELIVKLLVGRRVELGLPAEDFREKLRPLWKPFKLRGLTCGSLLDQGGFATVVVCVDEVGVSYAVKMPTQVYIELTSVRGAPTKVDVDLKPFMREVEALRSVSGHRCIVGFHGFIDSPPALVFELCRCSLRDVLRRGGLGLVSAAEVLVQIADALAFLHSKGYVHGDVKPENILFSFEGVPKLSDFNTAKALATVSKTKPGYTPGYAAPEQLEMEGKVTEKADSWALGLVLYEAVTGRPLLPLDDLGYREAVAMLERGEALARESTGIREIDELIRSCLKVNPAERPTAIQIRDTLAKYLATQM